jgi:hypothetical protein
MDPLTELLARLETDEALAALTDAEITEARGSLRELATSLRAGLETAPDKSQVAADIETLAAAAARLKAEEERRSEALSSVSEKADAAMAAFDETPKPEPEPEPIPEPVAAAARPSLAEIAKRRPIQAKPVKAEAQKVIVAAAGPDDRVGRGYEREEALQAMWDAGHGRFARDGAQKVLRIPITAGATVAEVDEGSWYENSLVLKDAMSATQKARKEYLAGIQMAARKGEDLPQPIVAAGFCAPAQPFYDFFSIGTREGIIDLPDVVATRGRVSYPTSPSVRAFFPLTPIAFPYSGTLDEQGGTTKPCYTVACEAHTTYEVSGYSTCLTFSNFDSQFYPERVASNVGEALIAHDHDVNRALIDDMSAGAGTTTVIDGDAAGGTLVNVFRSIAGHAAWYREVYRTGQGLVLDAILPYWVAAALQADQVARTSTVDYGLAVSELTARLARLGVAVQWVYDYQTRAHPNWPATFDYLLYPAGTVVRLRGRTLDLGTVRDSVLNAANDFQLFVETFDGIAIPGYEILEVTQVDACPTGATGSTVTITCGAGS